MATNVILLPTLHVALERLREAADCRDNLSRSEWLHVHECQICLETFVEIIRKAIAA